MLQSIRDRSQGWIAWGIVILLGVPFALWGTHNYFTGSDAERTVAEVDGEAIPYARYRQQLFREQQRLREQGEEMTDATRRRVAEDQVESLLLRRAAEAAGYRVSDTQVSREIRAISAFQVDGAFDRERYEAVLAGQQMAPGQFEREVRADLLRQQWGYGLEASEFVTDRELDQLIRLGHQEREVAYGIVSGERFTDQEEVTDAELAEYYEANQETYRIPEQVQVEYLEVSTSELAQDVEIDEAELRAYYEDRKGDLGSAELRQARHILIQHDDDEEAAAERAEELREQIENGADFESLAREHSEDPGSARDGGELGYLRPGDVAEPFAEALFALEPEEVSEPVRTDFGYHLIRLDDIREGGTPEFETVRDELRQELQEQYAEQDLFEQAETLDELAFEHPDTLQPAADALDRPIQESEPFSREGGQGLGRYPEVVEEAFSPDVLEDGYNSGLIELDADRYLVLRVTEHMPERVPDLEEIEQQVRSDLEQERRRAAARELADEIESRLRDGQEPQAVAEESGLDWREAGYVTREQDELPAGVTDFAYRLARPAESEARYGVTQVDEEAFAVVGVTGIRDGERAELDAETRNTLKEQLVGLFRERTLEAAVAELRDSAGVRIHEDRL